MGEGGEEEEEEGGEGGGEENCMDGWRKDDALKVVIEMATFVFKTQNR